jgi:hypothetical protein
MSVGMSMCFCGGYARVYCGLNDMIDIVSARLRNDASLDTSQFSPKKTQLSLVDSRATWC